MSSELLQKIVHDVISGKAECDGRIHITSTKSRDCRQPATHFFACSSGYLAACNLTECFNQIKREGAPIALPDLLTAATTIPHTNKDTQ